MSFSAKTALFKFRMSFFKKVSIETAHQSNKLEKRYPIFMFSNKFPIFISQKKFPILFPILIPIFLLNSIEIYNF